MSNHEGGGAVPAAKREGGKNGVTLEALHVAMRTGMWENCKPCVGSRLVSANCCERCRLMKRIELSQANQCGSDCPRYDSCDTEPATTEYSGSEGGDLCTEDEQGRNTMSQRGRSGKSL